MSGVTIDDVRRVASQFVGNIEQIPPMVSAVKIDGKRLHELAREGKTVERKPRPVTVHELTIDPTFVETPQDEPDVFRFTTRCGSGTYIRTIAADIGAALGGGAHIRYLRRTAIGRHTEAHASTLEKATIISLAEGLADYRSVILDDDTVARVRNGQRLSEEILTGAGPWVLLDGQGAVVAVHERVEGGKIKPAVVIPAET
jgi:tRNA pseudouridine55 synthase